MLQNKQIYELNHFHRNTNYVGVFEYNEMNIVLP